MSIKFLSAHTVRAGDTVASLVARYRLSSWRAIADIAANKSIRGLLTDTGTLTPGIIVHIAPNAGELARERLQALHGLRPAFLAHFDKVDAELQKTLTVAFANPGVRAQQAAARDAIAALAEIVSLDIADIASRAATLVTICKGMTHTHVAHARDTAAAAAASDDLCSLYWALSPHVLELWRGMWAGELWAEKWRDRAAAESVQVSERYLITVRSIVIQQIDQRIRETQTLERSLLQEARG